MQHINLYQLLIIYNLIWKEMFIIRVIRANSRHDAQSTSH